MKSFRTRGELPIPTKALGGEEKLRLWLDKDNNSHFAIRITLGEKVPHPGMWGMIFHDIAVHFAHAYKQAEESGIVTVVGTGPPPTESEILDLIVSGFNEEHDAPTADNNGGWRSGEDEPS